MSTLNSKQQKFLDVVTAGTETSLLTGEGGTGKSFLTDALCQRFPTSNIALTATTHKAAANLHKMTNLEARTVHSVLGWTMQPNQMTREYELVKTRAPDFAPSYPLQLLVVDEVSMLPACIYDDIMAYLEDGSIGQAVFIGDPIQLEAVEDGVSKETIEQDVDYQIELTEQMRFKDVDEATTAYLSALRNAIETNNDRGFISLPEDSRAIKVVDSFKEFAHLYKTTQEKKKIIAYRNKIVEKYNFTINGKHAFAPGDEVIIDTPIPEMGVHNGYTLEVAKCEEKDNFYLVSLTDGRGVFEVMHWKSRARLKKILDAYAKDKNWNDFWELKDRSMWLKHKYSCTVHKSQGSTYNTVFIDGKDLLSAYRDGILSMPQFNRLLYVAMSRMSHEVIIFTGSKRKYDKLKP